MIENHDVAWYGEQLKTLVGLSSPAVGVRFLADAEQPDGARMLKQHRYCQALMRARHGESVLLDDSGITCPAAAAAFGFRPLPTGLQTGKGLVGFGIVADEAVGRRMFEAMPHLEAGRVQGLHLFPLDQARDMPDVVVIEDEVERLMWISLAYLHATGGERVDSGAPGHVRGRDPHPLPGRAAQPGFWLLWMPRCHRPRLERDGPGLPRRHAAGLVEHLEYLARKAIPTSRSKKAWEELQRKGPN